MWVSCFICAACDCVERSVKSAVTKTREMTSDMSRVLSVTFVSNVSHFVLIVLVNDRCACFVFLMQAVLFYLPSVLWHGLNSKSGVDVDDVIEASHALSTVDTGETNDLTLKLIVKQFDRFLLFRRKDKKCSCRLRLRYQRRKIITRCSSSISTSLLLSMAAFVHRTLSFCVSRKIEIQLFHFSFLPLVSWPRLPLDGYLRN
jgi:Innexin